MAGSTPIPPDSPAPATPAAPAPRHETLTSLAAQVAAIDELVGYARASIRVFDVDLGQTGWNSPTRTEALAAFLRARNDAKLDIIVHETRWIEASGARIVALLRRYSHGVTIRRTGAEARSAMDPLLIVDGRHYLHRFHIDHPRAALGVEEPLGAKPLITRFEEIWGTGEPGLTATVLGL